MAKPSRRAINVLRKRKRVFQRRKVCRFCAGDKLAIDIKKPRVLRSFVSERGKIIPRRITGTCEKHHRTLTPAIKKSRRARKLVFAYAGVPGVSSGKVRLAGPHGPDQLPPDESQNDGK